MHHLPALAGIAVGAAISTEIVSPKRTSITLYADSLVNEWTRQGRRRARRRPKSGVPIK